MSADFGADPPMIASCVFRVDGLECSSNSEPGFELGVPEGRHLARATSAFVNRIADLSPQLVTFNGSSFDLPVLRYRAMVCGVAAPGLALRPYFNRYMRTQSTCVMCWHRLAPRTRHPCMSCAA
jgi:hypothetical protein